MSNTVTSPRTKSLFANREAEAKMNEILAREPTSPEQLRLDLKEVDELLGQHWSLWEEDAYGTLMGQLESEGRLRPDMRRRFDLARAAEAENRGDFAEKVQKRAFWGVLKAGGAGLGLAAGSMLAAGALLASAPLVGVAVGVAGVLMAMSGANLASDRALDGAMKNELLYGVNDQEERLSKLE